tara:strand:- start:225 stop:467 length:243 start_codon:yes stop_codon:yes gene_type:complete
MEIKAEVFVGHRSVAFGSSVFGSNFRYSKIVGSSRTCKCPEISFARCPELAAYQPFRYVFAAKSSNTKTIKPTKIQILPL